jgi:hypothetical protein
MNRTLVFLLLLALIALGVAVLLPKPYEAGQVPPGERRANNPQPAAVSESLPTRRSEITPHREAERRTAIAPRGVHGRVLDERALPVRGARVSLIPHTGEGAGEATSDEGGLFRVRSEVAGEEVRFDVRVRAEGLIETGIGGLALEPLVWRDVGTFRLKPGALIEGTVVATATGRPIQDARVSILGLPGERLHSVDTGAGMGVAARTDAEGRYRIDGAPFSALTIVAVAKGHAQAARENAHLERDAQNRFDFALSPGFEVPGRVADREGRPIASVRITAREVGATSRAGIQARSDAEGRFELEGLTDRHYKVTALHAAFADGEAELVGAGTRELRIVLARLGSVEILAMDSTGAMLTDFFVTVRKVRPGTEAYGYAGIPKIRVRTEPAEFARIEGLAKSATPYVLQVEAEGNAHGFSEPFEAVLDGAPARVFVKLDQGGTLAGFVRGGGRLLAGASVVTRPDGNVERSEAMRRLGESPTNLTAARARSGEDGRFVLQRLFPGRYFLLVGHADWCEQVAGPFDVQVGEVKQVPDLELQAGCLLSGTVRLDGALAPGIKVVVTAVPGSGGGRTSVAGATRMGGRFAMTRRLPPGAYQVVAGRPQGTDPGAPLAEAPRAVKEVLIREGMAETTIELEIRSR